jgi:hypothetical protein
VISVGSAASERVAGSAATAEDLKCVVVVVCVCVSERVTMATAFESGIVLSNERLPVFCFCRHCLLFRTTAALWRAAIRQESRLLWGRHCCHSHLFAALRIDTFAFMHFMFGVASLMPLSRWQCENAFSAQCYMTFERSTCTN